MYHLVVCAPLIIGPFHQGRRWFSVSPSNLSHVRQCPPVYTKGFCMVSAKSCQPSHPMHVSRTSTVGHHMCHPCACRCHVPTEANRILWIRGMHLCIAATSCVLQTGSFAICVGVSCGDGVSGSDISSSLVVPLPSVRLWRASHPSASQELTVPPCNTSRLTVPWVGLQLQFCVFAAQA